MMPIEPMSITHAKEMQAKLPEQIRYQNILVLILFIRVSGLMPNASGKGKLRYAIEAFTCYFGFNLL